MSALGFRFERMETRPDGFWVDVAVLDGGVAVSLVSVHVDSPARSLRELFAHEVRMSGGHARDADGDRWVVSDAYVFRPDGSFEHVHDEGEPPASSRTARRGRWSLDGDLQASVVFS